ncbi:hypothetical protein [Massilia putida]|uniref:hypothetical protein n=1 Tax=Massilia putida TaxID=1141883 RepID=UPI00095216C8|nr:hypothetical protein [Massilia putida]
MRANRILARPVTGLTLCLLLSSCAQPLGNGPVDWDHGARRGRVLEMLDAGAAASLVQACVPGTALQERYAKVRYRGARLHHTVVATLPDGVAVGTGDEVELRPARCDEGRLARVERVLPPRVVHAEGP